MSREIHPTATPRTRCLSRWVLVGHPKHLLLSVLLLTLTACGGSTPDDAALAANLAESPWAHILYSEAYTGQVVVMFAEGTDVQLVGKALQSATSADVNTVQQLVQQYPEVTITPAFSPEQLVMLEQARTRAAARGRAVPDLSLGYLLHVADPAQAVALISQVEALPGIRYVHPLPRLRRIEGADEGTDPTVAATKGGDGPFGSGTPDLVAQQVYLSQASGGLNVVAAWEAGVTGAGAQLVDIDSYWNFGHEDLPIAKTDLVYFQEEVTDEPTIQHGTAVAGILAGEKNSYGVQGIAPDAKLFLAQSEPNNILSPFFEIGGSLLGPLSPGVVVVLTEGVPVAGGTAPMDVLPFFADNLKGLAAKGLVIVEAGGNSSLDLAKVALGETGVALADTGALIVGGSTGPTMVKAGWSNCGPGVPLFAWGGQVATTGYGDLGYGAESTKWYTGQFDGTSAAAPQIAGIAALLQGYVKQLYAGQTKPWQWVYLDSYQMRDLLVQSGAGRGAKETNGCDIGVQPDAGKAIQLLKDGVVQPTIEEKPFKLCATEGWCKAWCEEKVEIVTPSSACAAYVELSPVQGNFAQPYDLDGDGRGDLITWSRDRRWTVDLSSQGTTADHFGTIDLQFDPGTMAEGIYFPVVGDYNTDGTADLAVYNSTTGKWYITYTDTDVLANQWPGWDKVIDYSSNPQWQPYSRPVPGDYDGHDGNMYTFDRWVDLAVGTPDGVLLIDSVTESEGTTSGNVTGQFDTHQAYLLDKQLQQAPGWAYGPYVVEGGGGKNFLEYVVPPTLPDITWEELPNGIGFLPAVFWSEQWYSADAASQLVVRLSSELKEPDGIWNTLDGESGSWNLPFDFGGVNCRPISADYDGDGTLDRSVVCPTEWRMQYSDPAYQKLHSPDGLRHIPLPNPKPLDPLPGYVYPGGVAYDSIVSMYQQYNYGCGFGPGAPVCTIFDLTTNYPPPIGPYFPICIKYWSLQPLNCLKY